MGRRHEPSRETGCARCSGAAMRIEVIGAGKFGSMFLSNAPRSPGLHVMGIADVDSARARQSIVRVGWTAERQGPTSFEEARHKGSTFITELRRSHRRGRHRDLTAGARSWTAKAAAERRLTHCRMGSPKFAD